MIMSSTLFLRRVLALDALSCAGMGVLLAAAAAPLAPLFGLPEGLVRGAGLLLLPLAAFIGGLASCPSPPPLLVWVVIVGNSGLGTGELRSGRPIWPLDHRDRHRLRRRPGTDRARPGGAGVYRPPPNPSGSMSSPLPFHGRGRGRVCETS